MTKTWFITGTSRGLGREFARAALERGDRVAATARDVSTLDDLVAQYGEDAVLALSLDVTDKNAVGKAVATAHEKLGRLDVVVNNAGYGLFGMVEEITEAQLRDQLETNLFGAFFVTEAVLPILRAQGTGHLVQISTVGGVIAYPSLGGYHASKWPSKASPRRCPRSSPAPASTSPSSSPAASRPTGPGPRRATPNPTPSTTTSARP